MTRTFAAKLEAQGPGGAWTTLHIPFNVEKEFGSRGRVSVKGTIIGLEAKKPETRRRRIERMITQLAEAKKS